MEKQGDAPSVGFIDNPHAPEVFSSGFSGFFISDGVVRITFESTRVNHAAQPGPINRVVIGRIAMPVAAAQALALGLYDFLKKQGLDPAPLPQNKEQIQ